MVIMFYTSMQVSKINTKLCTSVEKNCGFLSLHNLAIQNIFFFMSNIFSVLMEFRTEFFFLSEHW